MRLSLNRRQGTFRSEEMEANLNLNLNAAVAGNKIVRYSILTGLWILTIATILVSIHRSNKYKNKSIIQSSVNKMQLVISADDDYYTRKHMAEYSNIEDIYLPLTSPDHQNDRNTNTSSSSSHSGSHSHSLPLFVQVHCDLTTVDWYPTGDLAWQKRAPHFLLLGAKKAGTTTLWTWMNHHPKVIQARVKELHIFSPKSKSLSNEGKVMVKERRNRMYNNRNNNSWSDYITTALEKDDSTISFDATPGYLFFTTTAIPAILCTCPWAKLLVSLREPLDRILSHYNYVMDPVKKRFTTATFEDWIEQDFILLRAAGVIQEEINPELFYGSVAEQNAWNNYLDLGVQQGFEGPIGRSLYIIQIEAWFQALVSVGRDPETDFMVVHNVDLHTKPDDTYNRVLWWLELPSHHLEEYNERLITTYTLPEMNNQTFLMLKEFFKPYNQRLQTLLGEQWIRDWDNNEPRHIPEDRVYNMTLSRSNDNVGHIEETLQEILEDELSNSTEINNTAMELHLTPTYEFPIYNQTQGKLFTDKWCDLTDVNWYPQQEEEQWRFRAPYFILPGAKKSGTTSLASYVMQHPLVERARTKELQFFMNKNFRSEFVNENRTTLVKKARRKMYSLEYHSSVLIADKSKISFDATPGYLFFSSMLPHRILCVAPWIKLLLIFRNPVDRAYSNHAYVQRMTGMKVGFEAWIEQDIRVLKQSGFLNAKSDEEEDIAWREYLKGVSEGPIGRSLYDIQIRQWSKALQDSGRDPFSQIHIVRSEDIHVNKDVEYRKVLTFLGLPYVPLKDEGEKVVSDYQHPMRNDTRVMLEALFAPYNKRLYQRLGGDWDGFWDPAPKNDYYIHY
jgi:Sulfotransferase domain